MVQTWDAFWVRNVDCYFGEEVGEEVVKLKNSDGVESRPYLVYRKTNVKEFSETPTDEVDSYKTSLVCEKDLE